MNEKNEKIRIFNNTSGSVGYTTPKVVRVWQIKDSYKDVDIDELYDVFNENGARKIFESGALLIKDPKVRETFGLEELGIYIKDAAELSVMLSSQDKTELIDFLTYCSDDMLNKLIDVSFEMDDIRADYLILIEKYSGKEISEARKEFRENKTDSAPAARKIVTGAEPQTKGRSPRG